MTERAEITRAAFDAVPWADVGSSNVARIAFIPKNPAYARGFLYVEFRNGNAYRYQGVSAETFGQLYAAESVGRTLRRSITSRYEQYPCQRLEIQEEDDAQALQTTAPTTQIHRGDGGNSAPARPDWDASPVGEPRRTPGVASGRAGRAGRTHGTGV